MAVQRLLYTSRIVDDDAIRGETIARQIAETSAIRNLAEGLTGSLAYIDGHFIQVLEGDQRPIEETFERICCDFRHYDLKLIDCQTMPTRQFAEWNMACLVDVEGNAVGRREALTEIRLLATLNVREAVTQMRKLLDETGSAAAAA